MFGGGGGLASLTQVLKLHYFLLALHIGYPDFHCFIAIYGLLHRHAGYIF